MSYKAFKPKRLQYSFVFLLSRRFSGYKDIEKDKNDKQEIGEHNK